ncbi:MAG: hypothetical protein AAB660_01845 [Patescibacteria group bacterium]
MKNLLLGLVVVVVVALGLWFGIREIKKANLETIPEGAVTAEKKNTVEVTKTDITKTGSKLPQGFPSDIPVETVTAGESYKAQYSDIGMTQYTVSYTSKKSKDEIWTIYNDYMNGAGYAVDKVSSSKSLGQISGTKQNDIFSAIVSSYNGISLVQLSYQDRQ